MKFSLIYTSRRASCISEVISSWLLRADHPEDVEVILGIDSDYAEGIAKAERIVGKAEVINENLHALPSIKLAVNFGSPNCVSGWNIAAGVASGDVLIAIADDFSPPESWDSLLCSVGPVGWWEEDKVVWVADGYSPDLCTLAILTNRRYKRFGYIFYPGYESLFCDTEFTQVARQEGVIIDARHLLFEHLHPDAGKRARDSVDANHASSQRWKRGEMLFNFRMESGFPLDAGPIAEALENSYANLEFAVYVQSIRDDFCLVDVIEQLIREGKDRIGAVFICSPDEYWGGKPQTESDRKELADAEGYLSHAYQQVRISHLVQTVAPHRLPGLTRIQVETKVRNAAVDFIRTQGFQHILIADGDELWKSGLFDRLVNFVQEYRPSSVYTGMIPVIGLPGYPVEKATDKATIYIGPGSWFVSCRGVSGHRHEIPSFDIFHFTATRRTLEEIISKHRESGHADDADYAMEEWIEKVLPNIRPGFLHSWGPNNVGLHMYKPYQIWPAVRCWTKLEFDALPNSVKPYLAKP